MSSTPTTLIAIPGDQLLAVLNAHGWTQGDWTDDDGRICAHQAIRLCQPIPGDAYLIEQVSAWQGWGTAWNDEESTTEADVRARLGAGVDVTDADLADTFGPQWELVVRVVRQAATLTKEQMESLAAPWDVARAAAWAVARDAARDAAWAVARDAAWAAARAAATDAAWGAAWAAARDAARAAARAAARDAVRAAVRAAVTYDLAAVDGPYTVAQRDLLLAPWVAVFGPLEPVT